MPLDVQSILGTCPLFARLDGASQQKLAAIARRREFSRGEVIFRQEDPPPGVFVVECGLVRVYKLAPSGKEHVLHLVRAAQTFAEVAAVGDFPCPASAEAVEDTRCLLLPARPFQELLEADHRLCRQLLTGLSFWVRHLIGLLEDVVLRDAAGRVARHLLNAAEEQGATVHLSSRKKHVASHLNLTSETLSRTLRRLHEAGLIRSSGGQEVVVLDNEGLEAIATGAFPRV